MLVLKLLTEMQLTTYNGDYIHHRYLLLLSPNADTQFTIPWRVEGWVDLAGLLYTKMVHLPIDSHPSKY